MGSPATPRVVGRGGTATRCEGLPLGEPAQARRVTTMWQSQPHYNTKRLSTRKGVFFIKMFLYLLYYRLRLQQTKHFAQQYHKNNSAVKLTAPLFYGN